MKKLISKLMFGGAHYSAAVFYLGVGLVLLALSPAQPILQAGLEDPCEGACQEGQICIENPEGGYYCGCPSEE